MLCTCDTAIYYFLSFQALVAFSFLTRFLPLSFLIASTVAHDAVFVIKQTALLILRAFMAFFMNVCED